MEPAISDFDILRTSCTSPDSVISDIKTRFPELTTATVIRHLIFCNNDVEKTVVHLEDCKTWRQATFPMSAVPYSRINTDGCVLYTHGFDMSGRPILVFNTRLHNPKDRNPDEFIRWFVYMVEVALERLPPHLIMFTIFLNRSDLTHDTDFELGRRVVSVLDNYYPDRVANLIFYPVSPALKAGWGVIKHILSKKYLKVRLVPTLAKLRTYIPDEFIPAEIGGSCCYQFDMKDYPSPHMDNLVAGCKGASYVADDEVALDELYVPDTTDNFAERSIREGSVGGIFVERRQFVPKLKSAAEVDEEADVLFAAITEGSGDDNSQSGSSGATVKSETVAMVESPQPTPLAADPTSGDTPSSPSASSDSLASSSSLPPTQPVTATVNP
jgi:hypothetical protein